MEWNPQMRWKPDLIPALKRLEAFWQREIIDRPCISVRAPKIKGLNISPFRNDIDYHGDKEALKRYWTDPETIRQDREYKFSNTFFGGEALPALFQNYGPSGHCRYYGATPGFGQDTIWFSPIMDEVDPEKLTFHQEYVDRQLDIGRYLLQHAGNKYFVAMPDNCGAIDALNHLCGAQNLLMSMIEDPDAVLEAIHIINQGWKKAGDQFYALSRENCNGSIHAWMDLWAPGQLLQMQCDTSVMLSPEMFKTFAMPELEEQISAQDYAVYHFDGIEQRRHLDCLLSLKGLRAIQWSHVAGQPSPSHFIDTFRQMPAAGKGIIVMAQPEDVPVLLDQLSAKGLYIHCETENEEQAQAILDYAQTHFHE